MNDSDGSAQPARIGLNVAGLSAAERTALRELVQGVTFQVPALRLPALRRYLFAPAKPAEASLESERDAKAVLEEVDAALFAHGYGSMYAMRTLYAMREDRDGDALMCAYNDKDFGVTRVQVKGIRDPEVSKATLNDEIAKLGARYPQSHDLVALVAIHASLPYPLKDLQVPPLNLGGLYLLVAADDRLERWQLIGDLLAPGSKVGFEEFEYPSVPAPIAPKPPGRPDRLRHPRGAAAGEPHPAE